jgi:hypothetical protein
MELERMATASDPSAQESSTAFSVRKSLVTPYVPYTIYVIAYAIFGVALGAAVGSFNIVYAAAVAAAIWFGLEGLHAIDLADGGVAIRLNNGIANVLGYAQVAVGSAIGVWLAYETTWQFLGLVALGALLGLAYNEEWLNGWLHDRDKITGLANFGVSWGMIPFYAGVAVMYPGLLTWSGTVGPVQTLGILVIGLGICIDAIRLNYLEGHGAIPRYEDVGIEHSRDHKSTAEEARAACHQANVINIPAWVCIGVGTLLLFAL